MAQAVIGPQFCAPYEVDLTFMKKLMSAEGDFTVLDANRNIVFKIKGKTFSSRGRCVLLDAANIPIVSMQQTGWTSRSRWEVYRGDSSISRNLLFSVEKSSWIQTGLDVFLASNIKEDICDFKIERDWLRRSCVIYSGRSGNVVAQMHKNTFFDQCTCSVTVYPHVDHAFITTLISILNEFNKN